MVASARSIVATPFLDPEGPAERGEAQPGDLLLAFLSAHPLSGADLGIGSMTISGGGTWQEVASRPGDEWTGSRIMGKVVGSNEPTSYQVALGDDDTFSVVTILAIAEGALSGIVTASADGSIAPAATPGNASGLEIRYAAAAALNQVVSWAQLSGYSGLDIQVGNLTTSAIAVRQYVSSSTVPARDLSPSPNIFPAGAFTLLVKSAGSGGSTPPTPPTFPASTPGKGESNLRYTVHDLLTGQYVDDISPSGVTLTKFFNEPGSWRGRLDLANRAEARKINEIFPADPTDLTSGPGRLVVHTWASGVLWGVHWLHTTETGRDERGNVYMQVSGSTLDGYPLHVALETAGELILGDDQIQNARDLIQHMQASPGSNIGLGLLGGVSGNVRALTAKPGPGVTYGRILQDYARASDGFEFVVNPRVIDGSIIRSWEWGSPKIVGSGVHRFAEGEDGGTITNWREVRSALSGGTRWGAWGGTPEQEDATVAAEPVRGALITTPHVAAGWPIIDQRPAHPANSTSQTEVDNYAAYWAATAPGAPSVFTFDVIIGPGSTLGPNSLGDQVQATLDNPRYPIRADGSASFNRSQRLIGWELTPADRGAGGKDRIKLITESEVAEG